MLPEVSQLLHCPCRPLLRRVMLHHCFPNPAGAVESLKEVIVALVLQLCIVKVSLHKVQQPSDLGVGGIGNVAREILDLEYEFRLVLMGKFQGGGLDGIL